MIACPLCESRIPTDNEPRRTGDCQCSRERMARAVHTLAARLGDKAGASFALGVLDGIRQRTAEPQNDDPAAVPLRDVILAILSPSPRTRTVAAVITAARHHRIAEPAAVLRALQALARDGLVEIAAGDAATLDGLVTFASDDVAAGLAASLTPRALSTVRVRLARNPTPQAARPPERDRRPWAVVYAQVTVRRPGNPDTVIPRRHVSTHAHIVGAIRKAESLPHQPHHTERVRIVNRDTGATYTVAQARQSIPHPTP